MDTLTDSKGPGFALGYNAVSYANEGTLPNGTYTHRSFELTKSDDRIANDRIGRCPLTVLRYPCASLPRLRSMLRRNYHPRST